MKILKDFYSWNALTNISSLVTVVIKRYILICGSKCHQNILQCYVMSMWSKRTAWQWFWHKLWLTYNKCQWPIPQTTADKRECLVDLTEEALLQAEFQKRRDAGQIMAWCSFKNRRCKPSINRSWEDHRSETYQNQRHDPVVWPLR